MRLAHNPDDLFVQADASEKAPTRVQAMDWLLRLEASPADERLRHDFESWLAHSPANRAAYQAVQHTWARLGKLPKPAGAAATTTNVVALPARKTQGRTHRIRWFAAVAALAAACLALVAVPILQRHLLADYVTGVAELRDVTLPDGSVASLDAGSAIAIGYRDGERTVSLLEGQAFFQVVRDRERPFVVKADEVSVTVTGTAFSVRKTSDAVAVAVESGAVDVAVTDGARNSLVPGDRLTYDRRTRSISRGQLPPAYVASWRTRRLVVHEATVGELVEELGRHHSGVVVVRDKSLNNQLVSGVFDLANPRDALNALAESQGARLQQYTPYLLVIGAR